MKRPKRNYNKQFNEIPIHLDKMLSSSDVKNIEVEQLNLKNRRLNKIRIINTKFIKTSFDDSIMENAQIDNSSFENSCLRQINLQNAYITKSCFHAADMSRANLNFSSLINCDLRGVNLSHANLVKTNLTGSDLSGANLSDANLKDAILDGTNLMNARLLRSDLTGASITNSRVFGISSWKVTLDNSIQKNLNITPPDEPYISVDDIDVAQFIYLLLNYQLFGKKVENIIKKTVLLLGNFESDRKIVLQKLRDCFKQNGYTPIIFDFDKPNSRCISETVLLVANLSCFIIADITDPKCIREELNTIIPSLPSVLIQPIIVKGQDPYITFQGLETSYTSVLKLIEYNKEDIHLDSTCQELLNSIIDNVETMKSNKVIQKVV